MEANDDFSQLTEDQDNLSYAVKAVAAYLGAATQLAREHFQNEATSDTAIVAIAQMIAAEKKGRPLPRGVTRRRL